MIFKGRKFSVKKKSRNNISLAVYSVLIAVLVWFTVSMSLYPSASKTIQNIRLDTGTGTTESGLSIISCDTEDVEVRIKGSRTQIGNFNTENLEAYVDTESVVTSGKKVLAIKVRSLNNVPFEIESVKPENATIVFDKYETVQLPVSPLTTGIEIADGKVQGDITCEPEVISITGPSAQLSKISKVYAVCNSKSMELDSSYTLNSDEIKLESEDGSIIDQTAMKFDNTNFLVNIPVFAQKKVGMYVQIANAPSTFDTSFLNFSFSPSELTITSKNSQAEIPDSLEIGKVSLDDLTPDYSYTFDITSILETQNCVNESGDNRIKVTISNENLKTKVLFLDQSRISISNPPKDNYDYSLITQNLSVGITGPEEVIDEITTNDIIADVNLLNLNTDDLKNQFRYDVTFSCTKYNNVWATTKDSANCKAVIQRTPKETTTTASEGTVLSPVRTTTVSEEDE